MAMTARSWFFLPNGLAVGLALMALAAAGPAAAQTLEETLTLSYQTNPTLDAQRTVVRETNEQIAQALSGYRPNIEAFGDAGVEWQDTEFEEGGGGETDTLNPASLGIQLNQPLYRGGRTQASVRQAENVIQAARANFVSAEQDVLLNAVIAYMNVVREEAVLQLAINNEEVLGRGLTAARDRFEVGEITRTDVSQAESRVAGAVANRTTAGGNLNAARATFEREVGIAPGELQAPDPMLPLPPSLDEAMLLAESNNPDVIAQQFVELAADAGVDVVRGELLPEINLTGSVQRGFEQSAAVSRADNASVIAQVVVPLYESGSVSSRVREARYNANEQRIRVEELRRQAIEEAVRGWEGLQSSRASIESLIEQVRSAEIALEGVRQEAQVGARTVLDVLDAEQELLDARVSLVSAQRDEIVAAYQLLSAVGGLTARNLNLPVDYYDFDRHYNETRRRWWGTSIEEADGN